MVYHQNQYGENSKEATPVLGFHGTKYKNISSILNTGKKKKREMS